MTEEYYKLVRDHIPQVIVKEGNKPYAQIIEDDRLYRLELQNKLKEEVNELVSSLDIEEFADVLEVLESLAKICGVKWENILDIKKKKKDEKGGFEGRVYLNKVERI